MERSYADVVVIGAGPAGLTLAEVLGRRGMSVAVVEKQSDPTHGPQGALLQPVTLELLHRLVSFEHSIEREGSIEVIEEFGPTGQIFSRAFAELVGCSTPYALNVTQGQLRSALFERVTRRTSVTVLSGTEVRRLDSMDVGDCRTIVGAADSPGDELCLESQWIVAADGKVSSTRRLAGIGTRVEAGAYALSLIPLATPKSYPRSIRVHRRHDGMATTVPGAAPGFTYVFTHTANRTAEPGQTVEWAARVVGAEDRELSDALVGQGCGERIIKIEPTTVNATAWRKNGVLLLGDSAHGMHNIGGQGLNTSIQDALVLADAIDRHAQDGKLAWIDDFIEMRRPFIGRFQQAQRRLGAEFWSKDGASESWFDDRFEELSLGQADFRYRWFGIVNA